MHIYKNSIIVLCSLFFLVSLYWIAQTTLNTLEYSERNLERVDQGIEEVVEKKVEDKLNQKAASTSPHTPQSGQEPVAPLIVPESI